MAVRSQPRQVVQEALSQKYPSQKRAGGVAQYHTKKLNKERASLFSLFLKESEKNSYNLFLKI
jgi:hypothetical protein